MPKVLVVIPDDLLKVSLANRSARRLGTLSPNRMADVDRAILICFGMERLLV